MVEPLSPLEPIPVVMVGCGNIARTYAAQIAAYPEVRIAGFQDADPARAEALAAEFGGRAFGSLDEALADDAIALAINLTPAVAHESITRACLEAGKHVHTEKPMALTPAAARELYALASARGLRLSCAPVTFLGEAQQTVAGLLREERCGTVRLIYAEINHGRIESWHPAPAPFYDVGVLWDVGIYPITLLCALFGPVRSVAARQRLLLPEREDRAGARFRFERPEFITALLDFESGPCARLTCNFYATHSRQGSSVEFHGDRGSIFLGSSFAFDAPVEFAAAGSPPEPVPHLSPAFAGVEFARGVRVLARCIADGVPHPTSAEMAAHSVEVLAAIDLSAAGDGSEFPISSRFAAPSPGALDP
jgi:predicted dehydrogenase